MISRLLLVEDDPVIGRSLTRTLEGHGLATEWVTTAAAARASFQSDIGLVLVDLGLPDEDGIELCRLFRAKRPNVDIVIVTARRAEGDILRGLNAGADDYIVKPFRLPELLARVRARLRRRTETPDVVTCGPIVVDIASRRAACDGTEIELRPKEFDLLALLARESGRVVTRERAMSEVWDAHWYGSTKTLDIHISTLRRKMASAGAPNMITTLRNVGYRMERP